MAYLIGIDIGTSSVKTLILDAESGAAASTAAHEYPISQPQPGYAEQNPQDWWGAVISTVRAALAQSGIGPQAVAAVGLCGQMHGTVCLGEDGQPLRPAIIWADTRSKAECDALLSHTPAATLAQWAPGRPAAGFMGPTLMWLAQHEPDTLAATRSVALPKDYVRFCLTGEIATEPSDAAATWLFDVASSQWSDKLLSLCGLEERYLPPVRPSADATHTLLAHPAAALGLPPGLPVVTGCADQPAQALGYGLYQPGTALVTIGTGGQVFYPLAAPQIDPALRYYVFNHALPDRWYAAAATLAAGLSLRWLRDLLGLIHRPDAYAHLSQLAAAVPPGADGLVFLPYLAGERTPHFDPQASGVFLGLRLHHHAGHMARAIMEGVAFSLADCLALLPESPRQVIISGGGAASPIWRQIQADIYNHPVSIAASANHACVGAALLAGVGAGIYGSIGEACSRLPAPTQIITPHPEQVEFYARQRLIYASLYDRLRDDMHRLAL